MLVRRDVLQGLIQIHKILGIVTEKDIEEFNSKYKEKLPVLRQRIIDFKEAEKDVFKTYSSGESWSITLPTEDYRTFLVVRFYMLELEALSFYLGGFPSEGRIDMYIKGSKSTLPKFYVKDFVDKPLEDVMEVIYTILKAKLKDFPALHKNRGIPIDLRTIRSTESFKSFLDLISITGI